MFTVTTKFRAFTKEKSHEGPSMPRRTSAGVKQMITKWAAALLRVIKSSLLLPPMGTVASSALAQFAMLGHGVRPNPIDLSDQVAVADHARWDWLMIMEANDHSVALMNACQALNPDQQYVVRLWPINGLGEVSGKAGFLDYRYGMKNIAGEEIPVKDEIHTRLYDQIETVLSQVTDPEAIVGFTFIEEVVLHWSYTSSLFNHSPGLHPVLKHYYDHIKDDYNKDGDKQPICESGTPGGECTLSEDFRSWLGSEYVASLNEIYAVMRDHEREINADGSPRMIFHWTQYTDGHFGYSNRDIVDPGVGADGLMIYPLSTSYWTEMVEFAEENGIPYFSQLPHRAGMRQNTWATTLAMVNRDSEHNLGYYLHEEGNVLEDSTLAARNDFDVPPRNSVQYFSREVNVRQYADLRGIKSEAYDTWLQFQPQLDAQLSGRQVGDVYDITALIVNPKREGHRGVEPSVSVDHPSNWAKGVTATLTLPPGLQLVSGSETVFLGDLKVLRHHTPYPDSQAIARWRVQVTGPISVNANNPLRVTVRTSDIGHNYEGSTELTTLEDVFLPSQEKRDVVITGHGWNELYLDDEPTVESYVTLSSKNLELPDPMIA